MKNISCSGSATLAGKADSLLIGLLLLISLGISVPVVSKNLPAPEIVVIYPKEGQIVHAKDSTFILGHVKNIPRTSRPVLRINDLKVSIHSEGGFLAYLPIAHGEFDFLLEVTTESSDQRAQLNRHVTIPKPRATINITDTLTIAGDYRPPIGDLSLIAGDKIEFSFHGTSGGRAYCSIEGLVDSIPMAETAPSLQPFWGESVFGAGAVPDSLKLAGIYSGSWRIPDWARVDNVRLIYHLSPPPPQELLSSLWTGALPWDARQMKYLTPVDTFQVIKPSGYHITLNDPAFPVTVKMTDSVQIIRFAPRKGYFSIFQPEGVQGEAIGMAGGWYKLRLSETQYAYAAAGAVEILEKGILTPRTYLTSIRTYGDSAKVVVEFPLAGRHPFRIIEEDARTIRIHLFGVTSDTDWIRYDFDDKLIDLATWSQPEPGLYELKLKLTKDVWGYDTYYQGNTFYFQLNKPPGNVKKIKGKRIVIDPGHSSDPGSIGATGFTEAEANLGIALEVKRKLESKGAVVIMTRADTSHVALYDRPAIAKHNDADLFVSIHNNALPDGVNPYSNNGTSSYYYHPHSIDLAREIHTQMIKRTKLPGHGLFHGNLAVNRPTQYPAVLVECAFMIIPEQEAMLKTDKFRREVAKAITKGIEQFLKNYDKRNK